MKGSVVLSENIKNLLLLKITVRQLITIKLVIEKSGY